MPLTQTMRDLFSKLTTTEDSTSERFGSTGAYIHVGSSTGTFTSTQNSMLSTGAHVMSMDSGYPKRNDGATSTAANILVYRGTATTSQAVFDWNEWGVKNTTSTAVGTGTLFNRLQTALGTKANTQSWQLTVALTVTT